MLPIDEELIDEELPRPKLLPAKHVPSDCIDVPDGQFAVPP